MKTLAVKNTSLTTKNVHDNSVASFVQDFPPPRIQIPEQKLLKFSTTSLKDRGLLVPTRLALKRQRPPIKPLTIKHESVNSDTFQIELGHLEESTTHRVQDYDKYHLLMSQNAPFYPEQSTAFHPNSARGDTPYTAATDISLMYREKPVSSHPVAGYVLAQSSEENGGPSPCSYVLPRKPCQEKNAPAFTFGSRCLVEKNGGSRTGWQKQWFAHSDPYTIKVDFNRETAWPTPLHYPAKPTFGHQTSKTSFPAWSFGVRLQTNPTLLSEKNPSPDTYDTISAFHKLTATNTHITLKSRPGGTQVSTQPISKQIPGPGAHDQTKFLSNKYSAPKHSFGRRLPTSLRQDPYVNTISPIEA